jgi:hypothetical protein
MSQPSLTFFCERSSPDLEALFAQPNVVDDLKALSARVSLALLDFSPARAAVVQKLTAAGIPVVAWLVLPPEQGYWFNAYNSQAALQCYEDFKAWTAANNLQWAGLGLNFEPDLKQTKPLLQDPLAHWQDFLRRLSDGPTIAAAEANYRGLLADAYRDGFAVESYLIPLMQEERLADSSLSRKLLGLVDVVTPKEVLMLYSNRLPQPQAGLLWSYAINAQAIGLGLVQADGADSLSQAALERDLRLSLPWSNQLYIYSLEGCVAQGQLSALRQFNWSAEPPIPHQQLLQVNLMRQLTRKVLWLGSRPGLVLGAGVALLGTAVGVGGLGYLLKKKGWV